VHLGELLRDDGLDIEAVDAQLLEDLICVRQLIADIDQQCAGPWRAQAACRGRTAEMFPGRGDPAAPARALCAGCPVLAECTEWSDTLPASMQGVIAGMSHRQRRERRKARVSGLPVAS